MLGAQWLVINKADVCQREKSSTKKISHSSGIAVEIINFFPI